MDDSKIIYIYNISDISQPRLIFITSFHLSGGPGRTWPGALSNRRGRTRDPWGATCGVFLDDLPHFHRFVPDVQVKIHGNSQGFLMDFSSTLIKDISFVLLPDRAPATQGSSPCATVSLVRAAPQS